MRVKNKHLWIGLIAVEGCIFICSVCVFTGIIANDFIFKPTAIIPKTATNTQVYLPTYTVSPEMNISPTMDTIYIDPRTPTTQALLTQAALAQTQAAEAILSPDFTPTSLIITYPTNTSPPIQTPTDTTPPCRCSSDLYNCSYSDYNSVSEAQVCFDYCVSIGAGDVHNLDGDKDGIVCEWGLSSD